MAELSPWNQQSQASPAAKPALHPEESSLGPWPLLSWSGKESCVHCQPVLASHICNLACLSYMWPLQM